jgi:hypothetical protein
LDLTKYEFSHISKSVKRDTCYFWFKNPNSKKVVIIEVGGGDDNLRIIFSDCCAVFTVNEAVDNPSVRDMFDYVVETMINGDLIALARTMYGVDVRMGRNNCMDVTKFVFTHVTKSDRRRKAIFWFRHSVDGTVMAVETNPSSVMKVVFGDGQSYDQGNNDTAVEYSEFFNDVGKYLLTTGVFVMANHLFDTPFLGDPRLMG